MNKKKELEREISELRCVVQNFKKNNQVLIERWIIQYGYTCEMIVSDNIKKIEYYIKRYGK